MTPSDPSHPASAQPQGASIVGLGTGDGPGPDVMAASSLEGSKVMSANGEPVGKIAAIMLDMRSGTIAYAVVSSGGFLGIAETERTIAWSELTLDTDDKCFILDAAVKSI